MSYSRNEIAINLVRCDYITRVIDHPERTRFHYGDTHVVVDIPYAEAVASFRETILALLHSGRPVI